MKHVSLSRSLILGLGLVLAGTTGAWAANGLTKCKDGTTGIGPIEGAAGFCAEHGGVEWWKALEIAKPTDDAPVFGATGKIERATN